MSPASGRRALARRASASETGGRFGGANMKESRMDTIKWLSRLATFATSIFARAATVTIVLFTLLLLSLPNNLACGHTDVFIEKWPCVIMEAGTCQYVMEKPGGQISRIDKLQL
jgi:hypothetical protein